MENIIEGFFCDFGVIKPTTTAIGVVPFEEVRIADDKLPWTLHLLYSAHNISFELSTYFVRISMIPLYRPKHDFCKYDCQYDNKHRLLIPYFWT